MLGGERDVYPNFTQALELSAEIGGEFACTLLSLARGAVWEYQRQLWDEADRVQRGLLGAERALAARQVDAVFRARALAERREQELRTVQRIIEQTETRAEAAEDAAADGVASAARDADSAVTNAAIKVRARGSTDPCSISHEKRSPPPLFSPPLSTRRVKNNAAIQNRAPRPRRRVSRASATPRRR